MRMCVVIYGHRPLLDDLCFVWNIVSKKALEQKMNQTHIVDSVCNCVCCMMIDAMWGDPDLNPWESEFVKNVAYRGWVADYSDKQKAKIKQIFSKRRREVLAK